ncbi:MAG: cupin domain-containing protein [candidate division NC10 bacterium]|nr:cupin domain-containing protein [candidate division NC10 bacterium]
MIKNRNTQEVRIQKNPFGGKGEIYRWFYFSKEDASLVKTVNEASMTPGSYSALHGWENAYEIMYFLEGEGTYQKDDEGPVPIKAGDVVLHKPGERWSIHNTSEKPLRYLVVLVTSDEEVRPLK